MSLHLDRHSRPTAKEWLGRYARLVKYQFILDFFLALAIVATALVPAGQADVRAFGTLLLFALGMAGVLAAVMTFDDVTGVRDGSDAANYAGAEKARLRPLKRKPLLTGELTLRQAEVFGYASLVWGVLWWTAAFFYSPYPRLWVLVLMVLLLAVSVQYSWGLKLSYHGLGEATLLFSASAFVIVPYGLVTGELPVLMLAQGLLFGFGQALIAGYSNTNDVRGDEAVGRRTAAVLLSARGNTVFLGALSAANLLVVLVPSLAGLVPWYFALMMLPFMLMRIRQYAGFLRSGEPLPARSRGIGAFRAVVVCLLLFNLLHWAF